jgi:Transposase DDE domain
MSFWGIIFTPMYIRQVTKKNKNSNKTYQYYRLIHAYRIGDKTRQIVLLNLGTLDGLPVLKHKYLADRIEEILTGTVSLFAIDDEVVEQLAHKFARKIIKNGTFSSPRSKTKKDDTSSQVAVKQYVEVDLESAEEIESRDLGGEWLVKQTLERLDIDGIMSSLGMSGKDMVMAKALITGKMIHPGSELETERWLRENSATMELYDEDVEKVSRYQLYKVAETLYANKAVIESKIYSVCKNMFSQRSKVVIFDLTNIHFEGMMGHSQRAQFGRSKQKRNDCRLVSLALAIDSLGFVRGSEFWDGNVSEPETLQSMLQYIENQFDKDEEKPLLVFDAGITTDENLKLVKDKFDYICVSRTTPDEYKVLTEEFTQLQDNKGDKIQVRKIVLDDDEIMLQIVSDQKKIKEESIDTKITKRFEEKLTYLKEGLTLPRRLKKIIKVHEHVGRLKDQFAKVAQHYEITYVQDDKEGVITDITWERNKGSEKPKGEYFLRFSKKELSDKEIWDGYNLTREVEASFKCLKSDLNVRPIFHHKDKWIETHIWLSVLAYQIVNFIRIQLKDQNIQYSWTTIVEKLKTQRITTTTMDVKGNKKAILKTCTQANEDVKRIYGVLKFKDRPYVRRTKVVTQL